MPLGTIAQLPHDHISDFFIPSGLVNIIALDRDVQDEEVFTLK